MAKSQKKRDIPAGATAVATNRVARRDYDILDEIEFGIVLKGSEVKSLRESKVQLHEAYAIFFQRELWLVGLNISVLVLIGGLIAWGVAIPVYTAFFMPPLDPGADVRIVER